MRQQLKVNSQQSKYVIVGNSTAAVAAIEKIRDYDRDGKVTVVSDERHCSYSRPLITNYLAGKIKDKDMCYRNQDFYKKNKVTALVGRKAVALDTKRKRARLDNGRKVSYDKLLIATGGRPFVPLIKGVDKKGVLTFTTWDDAVRLKKMIPNIRDVVVVGGGFIGLKTAEALAEVGLKVVIVELLDRVLATMLDKRASLLLEQQLKKNGIKVIINNTVVEVLGDGDATGVRLKDGKELACQAVVVAIGVSPSVELVKGTKIKVNKGIIVNNQMQTNVADVYAAGDVTEAPTLLARQSQVIPIWPDAYLQGTIAGSNMTGNYLNYPGGLNMNSVDVFGLPAVAVGQGIISDKGYEIISKYHPKDKIYKKIVLRNDVVIGSIFVGDIERAGIITGLIKDKTNVKSFKKDLLKDDFGYISLPKNLREEKLAV